MRVVQVSGYRDPRGRSAAELLEAWPSLLDVARAAAGAGVEVAVVQAAAADERVRVDGIEVHFVAERGWAQGVRRPLATAPRVAARVRALAPRVVHLHGLGFPLVANRLARLGVPLLVQDHGDRPLGRMRPLQRWGLRRAAGILFTDRAQAEPFRDVLPAAAPVHEVLESTTHFRPGDRAAARAATGTGGDPCILWVGRLNHDKGPMTFLDALTMVLPALPGARVWMAYSDQQVEAEVRARLRDDPRLARVTLLGRVPREQVEQLCRAADLFVSCSRREGSGYALLEALACGATPVVSDIPAFRRILRGGRVGALFPVGDARALSDRLLELGSRPLDRETVTAHFHEHLSADALGRELRAVYQAAAS